MIELTEAQWERILALLPKMKAEKANKDALKDENKELKDDIKEYQAVLKIAKEAIK